MHRLKIVKRPHAEADLSDESPDAKEKRLSLKVQDIQFSQASIAATFTSGEPVSELIKQLVNSEISPTVIPAIRVVKYKGRWIALDNRRLRAFKDSFVDSVDVIICDLKDGDIKREFDSKRTNKSLREGGELRAAAGVATSVEHFQQGIYVFTKKILSWTFEQLAVKLPSLPRETLPLRFSNLTEYYDGFLELILEETRAILQAGIEASEHAPFFDLVLIKTKIPKRSDNPYVMTFKRNLMQIMMPIKSNDALLLRWKNKEKGEEFRLIALVINKEEEIDSVCVKAIIEEEVALSLDLTEDARWQFCILGSVVTTMRMYDVCMKKPVLRFEDELLSPGEPILRLLPRVKLTVEEEVSLSRVNPSQQAAIKRFFNEAARIQLVQGPPGTGKTTTVIELLRLLAKRGERTLVCAPSNKAVQELVRRFIQACPDVAIAYAGVEEKLPEDLRKVFVHTWGKQLLDRVEEVSVALWKLIPDQDLVFPRLRAWYQEVQAVVLIIEKQFNDIVENVQRYDLVEDMSTVVGKFNSNLATYKQLLSEITWSVESVKLFSTKARLVLSKLSQIVTRIQAFFLTFSADDSSDGLEARLLNEAVIVFATLSVMGRKSCQEMDPVINLVCDEAAQATEAESLIPLGKAKRLILFGDVQQLSPTVISMDVARLGFGRSMMERLTQCDVPCSLLKEQYRMHPEISRWPSAKYYDGRLVNCAPMKIQYRMLPAFLAPYSFIHLEGFEESGRNGHSFKNTVEVAWILKLVDYLQKNCGIVVATQVAIITFYQAQAEAINERLKQVVGYDAPFARTVDGYQGGESDIVIVSCVRANPRGTIGFVSDPRRLNVALTRARYSLITLGNAELLERQDHDVAELIEDARRRGRFFTGVSIQEQRIFPKEDPHRRKPPRRAELCRFFKPKTNDGCLKGYDCDFAHSKEELQRLRNEYFKK